MAAMREYAQFALGELTFRAPTADDVQRAHELIGRCEVQDYGEPDTDLDDLTFDWDRIDLARDAWLVATLTGDLVGYGAVIRWRTELEYAIYADPSWVPAVCHSSSDSDSAKAISSSAPRSMRSARACALLLIDISPF
jgi:hypothetical protein